MTSSHRFCLALTLLLWSCNNRADRFQLQVFQGGTMGTSFTVKVVTAADGRMDRSAVELGLQEVLDIVQKGMSTYRPDSELSRFNQHEKTDWFPISPDCARVFAAALELSAQTGGAFDVTVGPLVNLWGFGPEKSRGSVPGEKEIGERKALVGWQKLAVRESPPAVRKEVPGLYCDLSAIAKGFGVDKVAAYLDSLGMENYMIEVGGEVRVRGVNHKGEPWRIGVLAPDKPGAIDAVVRLSGMSLATSGDYMNYFERDGVRYSHTIDPRTGRPIAHGLASVTVIHPSCMMADGLATAIDVLGPVEGYEFAARRGIPVFLLIREGAAFVQKMTPSFAPYLE